MEHAQSSYNENMEEPSDQISKKRKTRGSTTIVEVTRIRSAGERKQVDYNEEGVPVGDNGAKLKSFIGSSVRHHIPLTYATWIHVPTELKEKVYNIVEGAFVIDGRSKKKILRTAGVAFRQFKNWLTTHHILPFKDQPNVLLNPPAMYSYIDRIHWLEFVRTRLSEDFEKLRDQQKERRAKNKYNHRLSRRGYANLIEDMKKTSPECDLSRASLWIKARTNKNGEYGNDNVQEVANRIEYILKDSVETSNQTPKPNDALTLALGSPEYHGRVRGVGSFVTPTEYFHQVKSRGSKITVDEAINENEALRARVKELEDQIQFSRFTPKSEHGSCSKQPLEVGEESESEDDQQARKKEITPKFTPKKQTPKKEITPKKTPKKQAPKKEITPKKTPKKQTPKKTPKKETPKKQEIIMPTSNLPISLKAILRFAERIMLSNDSIAFQLLPELFGINRKSYILRQDIFDFCSMQEVKMSSMVAYMAYLHSSYDVSQYIFAVPSILTSGQNTIEVRARNLSSRLLSTKANQLVIAPCNPGGHWFLVAINAYDNIVYILDSMRTGSRDDIKNVTNTALASFRSQKNLKTTRSATFWKHVKCPLQVGSVECGYYVLRYMRDILSKGSIVITESIDTRTPYSQLELDEVRKEWADFLGNYM